MKHVYNLHRWHDHLPEPQRFWVAMLIITATVTIPLAMGDYYPWMPFAGVAMGVFWLQTRRSYLAKTRD